MKRPWTLLCLAVLPVLWVPYAVSALQEERDPADREEARAGEGDPEGSSLLQRSGSDQPDHVRRLISRITRLHKWMKAKLDLDREQQRAVHALFEEHLDELRATTDREDRDGESKERANRLKELQKERREAQADRDMEAVREIRSEIRELLQERHSRLSGSTARLVEHLEDELDEDQLEAFRKLVDRLGLGSRKPNQESMQELLRAVLSPELGLSAEKRRAIMDIMRNALLTMNPDREAGDQFSDVAGNLRAELMGELTESQWEKAESLLKSASARKKAAGRESSQREQENPPDE